MFENLYSVIVVPLLAWMAAGAVVLVVYLTVLEIAERRKNRRLDEKRQELGLSRS